MTADYEIRIDWDNDGDFDGEHDDISGARRVLSQGQLTVHYGRDQARALSPSAPGEAAFDLNNTSGDYSPENPDSPIAGSVLPARPVQIRAVLAGATYGLFRGHTDDFDVVPGQDVPTVAISCLDGLAKLRQVKLSTPLYQGLTTGQAIGRILDEVGWPALDRDVDAGASTIQWWWEEGTDAGDALDKIVATEGTPAIVYMDPDNRFVFRDRHHRLLRTASTTSQATFSDTGGEPLFSAPLVYDHGWRDIVNSVTFSVDERGRAGSLQRVWEDDRVYSVTDGQTVEVRVQASDPFLDAITPVAGTDFQLRAGAVAVSLSRTSGQSTSIYIRAIGGPALVDSLALRAYSVTVARTVQVKVEDTTSIERYGERSPNIDAPWANVHDAEAIGKTLMAHRAERLPIVSFRVVNKNHTRLAQQLGRDLSDRVTLWEPGSSINDAFYIERIEHTISQAGKIHETVFGCEKAPGQPTDAFVLGSNTSGRLSVNRLGKEGLDSPDTVFVLDQSRLDGDLLGT